MAFCPKCGSEVKENDTFCGKCGFALNQSNAANNQQAQANNIVYSSRSKLATGLLQIFLGSFGVGRFYAGFTGLGVAQLLVSIFTCGVGALWPFIDGIVILCTDDFRDADGKIMKD